MECGICRIATSGVHYQTRCCRACAAFFRRTVRLRLKYKCSKNQTCDIDKGNRYSCRHCRMKKCLLLGMAFDDEELPSTDTFLDNSDEVPELDMADSPSDFYSTDNACKNQDQFMNDFKKRLGAALDKKYEKPPLPFSLSLCQQVSAAYALYKEKWKTNVAVSAKYGTIDFNKLLVNFCKEVCDIAEFCSEIEPYSELEDDQKRVIFARFIFRFHQLERAIATVNVFGRDPDDSRQINLNGEVFDLNNVHFTGSPFTTEQIKLLFLKSEVTVNSVLLTPFKRLNADNFELMYLFAVSMWPRHMGKDLTPETVEKSRKVLNSLAEELYSYYKFKQEKENFAHRIYKLHNLVIALDRIVEIRVEDGAMGNTFDLFKFDAKSENCPQ